MKSNAYMAGLLFGVLVAVVVFIIIALAKGKKTAGADYDERQELVRGKAYKIALFTLMLYLAADTGLSIFWRPWAQPGVDTVLGIFFSVGVFMAICIRNDAFVGLREKVKQSILIACIVLAAQLVNIFTSHDPLVAGGMLTTRVISVACATLFAVELVLLLVHMNREKDGEDA